MGALALAACGSRGGPDAVPGPVTAPSAARAPERAGAADEATLATAGALRCRLAAATPVGPAEPRAAYAVAFGRDGGIVTWRARDGVLARRLTREGRPDGSLSRLPLAAGAEPDQVLPLDRSFVVVSSWSVLGAESFVDRCVDPTCSGWPAGEPQPHVCRVPCTRERQREVGRRTSLVVLGDDARIRGAALELDLDARPIAAFIPAWGSRFALLAEDGRWLEGEASPSGTTLVLERRAEPLSYLLPVRGAGPPALISIDESGALRVTDSRTDTPIGSAPLRVAAAHLEEARLQARWGDDHEIHLAWLEGDHVARVRIAGTRLEPQPPSPLDDLAPPFGRFVFWRSYGDGTFQRVLWPTGATWGEPIELSAADSALAARVPYGAPPRRPPLVEWTGARFVALYLAEGGDGVELRVIPVDCSGA